MAKQELKTSMIGRFIIIELPEYYTHREGDPMSVHDHEEAEIVEVYLDIEREVKYNVLFSDGSITSVCATHAGALFRIMVEEA